MGDATRAFLDKLGIQETNKGGFAGAWIGSGPTLDVHTPRSEVTTSTWRSRTAVRAWSEACGVAGTTDRRDTESQDRGHPPTSARTLSRSYRMA